MAAPKKKKNKSKNKKNAMSAKRLAAVESIERPAKIPQDSSSASALTDKNLAPKPADKRTADIIEKAHSLGLSVGADTDAASVQKLLDQFGIMEKFCQKIWHDITGENFDSSSPHSRRFNHVVSSFFEDGRTINQILEAASASSNISGPAAHRVKNALYDEFSDILPKRGFFSRLLGL